MARKETLTDDEQADYDDTSSNLHSCIVTLVDEGYVTKREVMELVKDALAQVSD